MSFAFVIDDGDGNGKITAKELGYVISSLGELVSHEQDLIMIWSVDESDFPGFLVLM